jgi:alpha-ketoglutarate-dependent taurine dioxygenase
MTQAPARFLGWQAADLAGDERWIFAANPRLAQATEAELQAWLAPVRQELKLGWGVAWIRGLGALPEAQLRRLYLAIGRGLGKPDTTYGELYDVTDTGACHLQRAIPVSQTRAATTMHTDSSQRTTHPRWVGLACVSQAPEGGGSGLASAVAVHDHLARHQPQALRRLHRCFHRDLVTPGGSRERQQRLANRFAVFQQAADGPSLRYMRHWIETGHARLGKPLAEADRQAFDQLDAALNDPRFRHPLRLEPGDLLFCDNHKTAHDREAYRDDPAAPRLMLRLWLNGGMEDR